MLTHLHAEPILPTRVVILGAQGFVALALAQRLAEDHVPIFAISRRDLDLTLPGADEILAEQLRTTDALVVTAALTPEKGRDTPTLIKNLRMVETVAAVLALKPCAHVVYLSSDAVYDSDHAEICESTPAAPQDLYGVMHRARELALMQVTQALRIPLCILRPCAIYGPGDTHNSYGPNRFIRTALAEGKIMLFGGGEENRDHVHIRDVVALISRSLAHRSSGLLNLVSGQSVSFAQVASEIRQVLDGRVAIESLPRSGPITHRQFDCRQLGQAFPSHTPITRVTALTQTIAELKLRQLR